MLNVERNRFSIEDIIKGDRKMRFCKCGEHLRLNDVGGLCKQCEDEIDDKVAGRKYANHKRTVFNVGDLAEHFTKTMGFRLSFMNGNWEWMQEGKSINDVNFIAEERDKMHYGLLTEQEWLMDQQELIPHYMDTNIK